LFKGTPRAVPDINDSNVEVIPTVSKKPPP
jgi:hypothetical protein